MEESIRENLTDAIWKNMDIPQIVPRQLSPLVLAYMGDCAYDIVIKSFLLGQGNMPVNVINKKCSSLVKANTQSLMMEILEEKLTETELEYYKRGRNAKSYTSAKNASITDYRRATGFEALLGYLYLSGQFERMTALVRMGVDYVTDHGKTALKPGNKESVKTK